MEGLQQTVRASLAFIGPDSAPSPFAPVTFTATANGAATTLLSVAGDSQVAASGDTLPVPLRVRTMTPSGTAVPGVRVHWTAGEGVVFPDSTLSDMRGEAAASWVVGPTIGEQTATAAAFLQGSPRTFRATVARAANTLTWTAEQLPLIPSCAHPAWTRIWAASATEVFAVGACGTICHFTGTSWDLQNSGTTRDLWAVWGRSATDVYAVGDSGTVLHFDGASWSAVADVPPQSARAIWGGPGELFVITADQAASSFGRHIWHYDGAVWTAQFDRACSLSAIWGSSPSDIFAVGPGDPVHYDGASWHDTLCSIAYSRTAVSGNGPADVYATGWFQCQSFRVPCTSVDFVEQYVGVGWVRRLEQPGTRLHGTGKILRGGNGLILHGEDGRWRRETSGTSATIIAVSASESTSVWAITADGLVLHGTRPSASAARARRKS